MKLRSFVDISNLRKNNDHLKHLKKLRILLYISKFAKSKGKIRQIKVRQTYNSPNINSPSHQVHKKINPKLWDKYVKGSIRSNVCQIQALVSPRNSKPKEN